MSTSRTWMLGTVADETGNLGNDKQSAFKVAPWKTNPGPQSMALLFNKGTLSADIATAGSETYGSTATAVKILLLLPQTTSLS